MQPLTAPMDLTTAVDFARTTRQSVLTTLKADGRPQLSNVFHQIDPDGIVRISITADRAKYVNLHRTPWAALHVTQEDFWAYVVLEGDVTLSAVAASVDDPTVAELETLYRNLIGEHANWDDYRAAMVAERRAVVRLQPTRAYGMVRPPRITQAQ